MPWIFLTRLNPSFVSLSGIISLFGLLIFLPFPGYGQFDPCFPSLLAKKDAHALAIIPEDSMLLILDKYEGVPRYQIEESMKWAWRVFEHWKEKKLIYGGGGCLAWLEDLRDKVFGTPQLKGQNRELFIMRQANKTGFSLPDGNVFITLGELAFMETQEDLAITLAHEAAHFKLEHPYHGLLANRKYGVYGANDKGLVASESRKRELQADSLAFHICRDLGISGDQIVTNLEQLSIEDILPEAPEWEHSPFWQALEGMAGVPEGDPDFIYTDGDQPGDSLSSHPTFTARIQQIRKLSEDFGEEPDKRFAIFGEEGEWKNFRKNAQWEWVRMQTDQEEFISALYMVIFLETAYPEEARILAKTRLSLLKALYSLRQSRGLPALIEKESSWRNHRFRVLAAALGKLSAEDWKAWLQAERDGEDWQGPEE